LTARLTASGRPLPHLGSDAGSGYAAGARRLHKDSRPSRTTFR